jgi:GTP-binding protein
MPAGGDGGAGGSVYLAASDRFTSFHFKTALHAQHGNPGKGNDMNGSKGNDYVLQIPIGTSVSEIKPSGVRKFVGELNESGEKLLIAKGGAGGKGNKNYPKAETNVGTDGEARKYHLEMKLIADIGFVGYPNAGKTTLLAALTRACPRIASYPFTTLHPFVGKLHFSDG